MRHLSGMMAPWFEAAGLCVRGGGFQKPCSLRSVIAGEGSPASDPLGDAAWSHPSHPSRYQGLLSRECWGQDGAGAWESSSFPPAASAVLLWAPHAACASLYLIDKRKPHASRSLVNSRVVIRGGVWGGCSLAVSSLWRLAVEQSQTVLIHGPSEGHLGGGTAGAQWTQPGLILRCFSLKC